MMEPENKPRVFFATPCYGGHITSFTARSMFEVLLKAQAAGFVGWQHYCPAGESLITRGRNHCVYQFLRTDCTHLFFIDADISFTPDDVAYVLGANLDVCAGAYPIKCIRWDVAAKLAASGKDPGLNSELTVHALGASVVGRGDIVEVKEAGTGFLCIKRSVIEKMIAAHPEWAYEDDSPERTERGSRATMHNLFHADIVDDWQDGRPSRRYMSEDYMFCRRWREMGGRVYLHLKAKLSHIGVWSFQGDPESIHTSATHEIQVPPERAEEVMAIFNGKHDRKLPPNPMLIVDAEAKEGAFAIWAQKRWPEAQIHVFEPDPELAQLMLKNLKEVGFRGHIHGSLQYLPSNPDFEMKDGVLT